MATIDKVESTDTEALKKSVETLEKSDYTETAFNVKCILAEEMCKKAERGEVKTYSRGEMDDLMAKFSKKG